MTRQIFSFKNHTEHERGRLVPDLFLFFKKGLYEVKPSALWLSFNIFQQYTRWGTIKKTA